MAGLDEKFKSMIGEQLDIQGKLKPVERRDERQDHRSDKDMESGVCHVDRQEGNAQSEVSCTQRGSKRRRADTKECLQYLAAGTAGTNTEQDTGYGAVTDRTAG